MGQENTKRDNTGLGGKGGKMPDEKERELLESVLREMCEIESVAGIDVREGAPCGAGPKKALDRTLEIAEKLGMRVTDRDGGIGWAEIGEGDEMVAVLTHLDVVPAGDGWDYPAYGLTLSEDGTRLYGRGTMDDKGPAAACLLAMYDLLREGKPLKRRIRILFGQSEETGIWTDMEWYREHEELPVWGFTPDADFPAIYGEKGFVCFELTIPAEKTCFTEISGGQAHNVVPEHCRAKAGSRIYEAFGKSAHASTPEQGDNAIVKLMRFLADECPDDPVVRFFNECVGNALHGEHMGCALSDDKSGLLTMNVGTACVRDGKLCFEIDVRNPVTFSSKDVFVPMKNAAERYGIDVRITQDQAPLYMDKNGKVIQSLLGVYRSLTGDMSEPMVVGGGTYARSMDNIVAFGPMLPGRELTLHQRNEYILREDLHLLREIYRESLRKLADL